MPVLAFRLDREPVRLGRARDNDIVLALPEIADHHAIITASPQGVALRALEGETFLLNGKPVATATLGCDDQVILGGYRLRLLPDDGAGPAAEGAPEEFETHHTLPVESAVEPAGG